MSSSSLTSGEGPSVGLIDARGVVFTVLTGVFGAFGTGLLVYYMQHKDSHPIKGRIPNLAAGGAFAYLLWLVCFAIEAGFQQDFPCISSWTINYVFVGIVIYTYMIRCWALYFAFNLTREKLLFRQIFKPKPIKVSYVSGTLTEAPEATNTSTAHGVGNNINGHFAGGHTNSALGIQPDLPLTGLGAHPSSPHGGNVTSAQSSDHLLTLPSHSSSSLSPGMGSFQPTSNSPSPRSHRPLPSPSSIAVSENHLREFGSFNNDATTTTTTAPAPSSGRPHGDSQQSTTVNGGSRVGGGSGSSTTTRLARSRSTAWVEQSNWFLQRSYMIQGSFLLKAFIALVLFQFVPMILLALAYPCSITMATGMCGDCTQLYNYIFFLFVFFSVLVFIWFYFKLRDVQEGFFIRLELKYVCILAMISVIGWMTTVSVPVIDAINDVYPITATYFLSWGYATFLVMTLYPISKIRGPRVRHNSIVKSVSRSSSKPHNNVNGSRGGGGGAGGSRFSEHEETGIVNSDEGSTGADEDTKLQMDMPNSGSGDGDEGLDADEDGNGELSVGLVIGRGRAVSADGDTSQLPGMEVLTSLESLLETDIGFQSFRAFLTLEFSVENLLFWSDIRMFQRNWTGRVVRCNAKHEKKHQQHRPKTNHPTVPAKHANRVTKFVQTASPRSSDDEEDVKQAMDKVANKEKQKGDEEEKEKIDTATSSPTRSTSTFGDDVVEELSHPTKRKMTTFTIIAEPPTPTAILLSDPSSSSSSSPPPQHGQYHHPEPIALVPLISSSTVSPTQSLSGDSTTLLASNKLEKVPLSAVVIASDSCLSSASSSASTFVPAAIDSPPVSRSNHPTTDIGSSSTAVPVSENLPLPIAHRRRGSSGISSINGTVVPHSHGSSSPDSPAHRTLDTASILNPKKQPLTKQQSVSTRTATMTLEARHIFAKFIAVDAPLQVNLPNVIFDVVCRDLHLTNVARAAEVFAATEPLSTVPTNLFDEAQQNIYDLMRSDSFRRYCDGPIYQELVAELKRNAETNQLLKNIRKL